MFSLVDKAKKVWFMIFQEIRPITGENINVLCIFFTFIKSIELFHNHSVYSVSIRLLITLS